MSAASITASPLGFSVPSTNQEVAVVEVAEAVHLVDRRDRVAEAPHDLRRDLEAEVHALGADMEKQVPGRRDGVARSRPDLAERVKLGRARLPEQAVPCLGPDPHDAGETGFEVAKFHRAQQCRKLAAERPHGGAMVRARLHRRDQEDRGARQWCGYGLGNDTGVTRNLASGHRIAFHRVVPRRRNFRMSKYRANTLIIACRPRPRAAWPCLEPGMHHAISGTPETV
jgi:hypothetical protein